MGLAVLALRSGGFDGAVPADYALRRGDAARVMALIDTAGLVRVEDVQAGDVLLCASGPGQLHVVIDGGSSVIHADAHLRRVVERPGPPPWPVIGRWRLALQEG